MVIDYYYQAQVVLLNMNQLIFFQLISRIMLKLIYQVIFYTFQQNKGELIINSRSLKLGEFTVFNNIKFEYIIMIWKNIYFNVQFSISRFNFSLIGFRSLY